jgi:hypothetical protein
MVSPRPITSPEMLGLGSLPTEQESIYCKVRVVQTNHGWNVWLNNPQPSSYLLTGILSILAVYTEDIQPTYNFKIRVTWNKA